MTKNNLVIPFTICNDFIRGRFIKLDTELNEILIQNNYPEPINRILAEMLLITAMLGTQFKEDIILSIQLQNKNLFKYIIVDFQSPNHIRGYAQLNTEINYENKAYENLIKDSILSVTIDKKIYSNQRYQGIVEVKENSLSKAVEDYFYQSEQIKTSIKLSFGNYIIPGKEKVFCGGGILIQQMPDDIENTHWNEAQIYLNTVRDHELIDPNLTPEKFLYSLYHEVGIKIYDYIPITYKCRCSKEKAEEILTSLGKDEALSIIVNDSVEISCQFCNKAQKFTAKDIEKLFT